MSENKKNFVNFTHRVSSFVESNKEEAEHLAVHGFYKQDDKIACFACGFHISTTDAETVSNDARIVKHADCDFAELPMRDRSADTTISPVNDDYSDFKKRCESFKEWPLTKFDSKKLAQAGLYYIEFGDKTCCFYCGLILKHWQNDDDPRIEHAKYSDCPFMIAVKGQPFLDACKQLPVDQDKSDESSDDENEPEISGKKCNICYARNRETYFNCGHCACCKCALQINNCHICNTAISIRFAPD